jgi:hypothetical protein
MQELFVRFVVNKLNLIFICSLFFILQILFVKLARNVMWWALQKHKVSTKYNTLIKDMYDLSGVDTSLTQRIPYPVQIGYRYSWDMPWICI